MVVDLDSIFRMVSKNNFEHDMELLPNPFLLFDLHTIILKYFFRKILFRWIDFIQMKRLYSDEKTLFRDE